MDIKIRWKDMSKHPSLEKMLWEKAMKIYDFKFVEGDIKAEFTYYESTKLYKLRLNVKVHNKGLIRSESQSHDPDEIVPEAINKTIDQLRKHKTKVNQNKH